jgi:hypothetical protein
LLKKGHATLEKPQTLLQAMAILPEIVNRISGHVTMLEAF